MTPIRIAIHGAAGRMGRRLVALASADPQLQLVSAVDSATHPAIGQDAGLLAGVQPLGIPLSSTVASDLDVVIDFSVPAAALQIARTCAERRIPLVLSTTGFEPEDRAQIVAWGQQIPIVWSPSMSMAVNLTMKLAALAAQVLKDYPQGADVEIIERHHRMKEDAPSGTALKFGEIIAKQLNPESPPPFVHGRSGRPGQRPRNEIGFHAVRIGDNPGEHTIVFGMMGETIELTVKASNRDCYAIGALAAAKFVAGKSPGMYAMADVLGL
ncbi:MAG: 4-hydroxy-tetrahydrodipicolinate reductase [Planctomycetes bacterium]|nr:4-hydroxy-tetrahydrodipicolinate reductase [Planctomycetota bacterium]